MAVVQQQTRSVGNGYYQLPLPGDLTKRVGLILKLSPAHNDTQDRRPIVMLKDFSVPGRVLYGRIDYGLFNGTLSSENYDYFLQSLDKPTSIRLSLRNLEAIAYRPNGDNQASLESRNPQSKKPFGYDLLGILDGLEVE